MRAAIAAMSAARVPQQPPSSDAPARTIRSAPSAKYSGLIRYMDRPPTCSGMPALGNALERHADSPAQVFDRPQHLGHAPAAVRAHHVGPELDQRLQRGERLAAVGGVPAVGDGHLGDDRQVAAALGLGQGEPDLPQIGEGFQKDQVGPGVGQRGDLLAESAANIRLRRLVQPGVAGRRWQRADPAGDERPAAGYLAGQATAC